MKKILYEFIALSSIILLDRSLCLLVKSGIFQCLILLRPWNNVLSEVISCQYNKPWNKMERRVPEMECIEVSSFGEQMNIMQKMSMMQRTHNALAKDLETLTEIAKENSNNVGRIEPLIRACIKELFSLVEGDLYLINQYLPYDGYNEMDNLSRKFKKTYRHHSKSFKKEQVKKEYQSKSYGRFYRLKLKRDEIVHPKGLQSIAVTIADLNEVFSVYQEYRNFINTLMTNIGFSTTLSSNWL